MVFDITAPNSKLATVRPKQQRPCNSMAFNSEGVMAVGFDKARQDHSLQLWNVEHYSRTGNNDHITAPFISYVPNEVILSTAFHPQDGSCLLAGSYKFLREFDLRSEQHVFQLGTRCTSGIQFDPFSPHFFASYAEDGTLCIWDRRKLTSSVRSLKAGSGTALNTFGVVHEAPLLTFNKLLNDSRKGNYSSPCFQYSTTRRGEFATLFNGELIRRWNTGVIPPSEAELRTYDTYLQNSTAHTPATDAAAGPRLAPPSEALFVVSVNDTKTKYERVISFDYAQNFDSQLGIDFICMRQSGSLYRMSVTESPTALEMNSFNDITIGGPEGTITLFAGDGVAKPDAPSAAGVGTGTGKSDGAMGSGVDPIAAAADNNRRVSVVSAKSDASRGAAPDDSMSESTSDGDGASGSGDDSADEDDTAAAAGAGQGSAHAPALAKNADAAPFRFDVDEILDNDISATIRRRAVAGYGTDIAKNVPLFERNMNRGIHLRNTWKWMDIVRNSSELNAMVSNNVDFAFEGVLGVWNGLATFEGQARSKTAIGEKRFDKAVKDLVGARSERRQAAGFGVARDSTKAAQRRLCLAIAGWDFTKDELDQILELLQQRGQHEKAAGWAVFHGDVARAVEILAGSKRERLRIMSTAIAGYMAYKDIATNSPWKEQCRRMASELDDPYLRAIFAFIADNDWWDVFDESSLPLREKIGVALRFLSDRDLTVFLNRLAEKVISGGELEGIILTGITPRGMDLLQAYVNKTSDVQTAALVGAFGCPRFFQDERVETWIDCYRGLLNSWSLFNVRAKFDVARTKLSRTFYDEVALPAAPRQVYLQCFRCNKNISKRPSARADLAMSNKRQVQQAVQQQQQQQRAYGKGKLDTNFCPHCGAPFPRCAICLLSLGKSLPDEVSLGFSGDAEPAPEVDDTHDRHLRRTDKQFREWFSFCLACNHGMHAGHAEEWFAKHYVCAVPDCNCRCNNR